MYYILLFVCGVVLAAGMMYLVLRSSNKAATAQLESALSNVQNRLQEVQGEKQDLQQQVQQMQREKIQLNGELQAARTELEMHKVHEKEEAEARRLRDEEAKREREAQAKEQIEMLSAKFESTSQRLLKERSEELGKANSESVGKLLSPIQEEMKNVRELMDKTRSANEQSTSSLKGALEMMVKQTQQISQDATNLADALKNRGKVHGDWGEQVLEDILRDSGLREGIEFVRQDNYKGETANDLRPDVVVNTPDGKRIIIDSKVSLKAYTEAQGATEKEDRERAIKENYDSVRKHVKELADKQYPKYVDQSMSHVLMFVPNEGAYVMAMNHDSSLGQEAFNMGVIIVNPTNLMLTLHLVLQSWQQTRQEDNCKKIIEAANGMYDKVIGLVDTCNTMGNQLETVNKTYHTAMKQLNDGSGNLLRRVEGLKEMGITSTKRVRTRKTVATAEIPLLENETESTEAE